MLNSFKFFFKSLKIVLINMVTILMMSAKITTLDLLGDDNELFLWYG